MTRLSVVRLLLTVISARFIAASAASVLHASPSSISSFTSSPSSPTPLPSSSLHFTVEEDTDAPLSSTSRPSDNAAMKKRSICAQGSCRWNFMSQRQTSFQVQDDRKVSPFRPNRNQWSDTALFEMTAATTATICLPQSQAVHIHAVKAKVYICISKAGKVYASRSPKKECTLCEEQHSDGSFSYYRALNSNRTVTQSDLLYLGVNMKCGKMMDARRYKQCANVMVSNKTPHFCPDFRFIKVPGDHSQSSNIVGEGTIPIDSLIATTTSSLMTSSSPPAAASASVDIPKRGREKGQQRRRGRISDGDGEVASSSKHSLVQGGERGVPSADTLAERREEERRKQCKRERRKKEKRKFKKSSKKGKGKKRKDGRKKGGNKRKRARSCKDTIVSVPCRKRNHKLSRYNDLLVQ